MRSAYSGSEVGGLMTNTIGYYNENAEAFFAATTTVDMEPVYQRFLRLLPPAGHLLDAGCGSGRDTKAFAQKGFSVDAFDASPQLAKLAAAFTGRPVEVMAFLEFERHHRYDGISACASLLHVPEVELVQVFQRLWHGLNPGGVSALASNTARTSASKVAASTDAWRG